MKTAFAPMVDKGWLVAASVLACAPVFAVETVKLERFQTDIAIIELTGFYLKKLGQPLRRVHCSSLQGQCSVRELMIAPGGCHVAYTPGNGHDRSFMSINLCSPEAP